MIDDPCVSNRHLRIYTIIYDQDEPEKVAPLVYAQDVSLNGTMWNGSCVTRASGAVLLSDGDSLSVCDSITFTFECVREEDNSFTDAHVREMMVSSKPRWSAPILKTR